MLRSFSEFILFNLFVVKIYRRFMNIFVSAHVCKHVLILTLIVLIVSITLIIVDSRVFINVVICVLFYSFSVILPAPAYTLCALYFFDFIMAAILLFGLLVVSEDEYFL